MDNFLWCSPPSVSLHNCEDFERFLRLPDEPKLNFRECTSCRMIEMLITVLYTAWSSNNA
jgi:hypothetical protein